MKPDKNESKQDFLKRCTAARQANGEDARGAFGACSLDWSVDKGQREKMTLSSAVLKLSKKDDEATNKKPSFLILAYSGALVDSGWQKLIIAVAGMSAKEKIPVLREHKRDRIVGFGDSWKDKNNFYVGGEFSTATADAAEVLKLAEEGYPWQASIGVSPKKVKVLSPTGEETVNGVSVKGPAEIWLESEVGEVSFVSLGADNRTAAITFSETVVACKFVTGFESNTSQPSGNTGLLMPGKLNTAPSDFMEKARSLALKRKCSLSKALEELRKRDPSEWMNYIAAANGLPRTEPPSQKHPFLRLVDDIKDRTDFRGYAAIWQARLKNQELYENWIASVQKERR